jgi:hypothetical protein
MKRHLVVKAKQAYWRKTVHEASISTEGIWKLAKWARTKSYLPPEGTKLPDLYRPDGIAQDPEAKANVLADRFYPQSQAIINDIYNTTFSDESYNLPTLPIERIVTIEQVQGIIRTVASDKCPGPDGIPNRFLKAMGEPLVLAIHSLIQACITIEYFPQTFRHARTIVLKKPSKPNYHLAGAWRPIALLNTIGKVFETVLATQLRTVAEENHLLPASQMGNRRGRSTESVLELLVAQIRTVWESKRHVASVLSMDITGAFDTVNHTRLLDNLRKKGIPGWFVRTIQSFLTDRTVSLVVDQRDTQIRTLGAGVPQGSPLSPILFLFYNAPLLEIVERPDLQVSALGFADDINLLAYSTTTATNCNNLVRTHQHGVEIAQAHGLQFAPDKFKLTHFTRSKIFDLTQSVQLDNMEVVPEESVRILGLWLDTRLRWKAHEKVVHEKMKTQLLALTRTTASTWGSTFLKARQLYLSILRSSLTFGAVVWHEPTPKNWPKPKGLAAKLVKHQNAGLRTVLGAFKATPIRQLETEAFVPPLDLWLNGRLASFRARLCRTGIDKQITNACILIRTKLRTRHRRSQHQRLQVQSAGIVRDQWALEWAGYPLDEWQARPAKNVERDWKARWQAHNQRLGRSHERPAIFEPYTGQLVGPDTPPDRRVLKLYENLFKAESSLLVQIRTKKIGLAKFLHSRSVPGFDTANCPCAGGKETPRHIVLFCPNESLHRVQLKNLVRTKLGKYQIEYSRLVGSCEGAKIFTRWLMETGRLGQFALAKQLLYFSNE